mgnify:FL=1
MTMSADERRELEDIDRALSRADPRLAGMLTDGIDAAVWLARRVAGGFVTVVVALLCGGLVLRDGSMIVGGCLVLGMMPITVCLIAAGCRGDR